MNDALLAAAAPASSFGLSMLATDEWAGIVGYMNLGEPLICLKNVSKGFSGVSVLSGINLTIRGGELIVVLGSNGSGKTTLLRVIAGLLGIDQGQALIEGKSLKRFSSEQRSKISFLPDFPPFFEGITVLENVETWINLYGRSDGDREKAALATLEEFGLLELAQMLPLSLSRGQRYKLALTCYTAVESVIGLFDEPFASGMDAKGLRTMRQMMKSSVEAGRAVVYTTQLVKYALDFADRILVIENHGIYFDGPVDRFCELMKQGDPVIQLFSETEE